MKERAIRIYPEDQKRVRDARFELMVRHRIEFDENAILHDFFLAKFSEYLVDRLRPAATEKKGKK